MIRAGSAFRDRLEHGIGAGLVLPLVGMVLQRELLVRASELLRARVVSNAQDLVDVHVHVLAHATRRWLRAGERRQQRVIFLCAARA